MKRVANNLLLLIICRCHMAYIYVNHVFVTTFTNDYCSQTNEDTMVMREGENERDLILIRFFKGKIMVQYGPFLH